ncbi:MAG: bleomycin resistance protein [Planctomycetota bacterium]
MNDSNANANAPKLGCVMPIFHTGDVGKALAWYRDSLGFKVAFQWPAPDSGEPAHYGGAELDGVTIHFSAHGGGEGSKVYIIVAGNIDALAASIKARGVTLENEPKTQGYGMREFDLKDPDGHHLWFAQSATRGGDE